jgi:sialate O-acetylesterase
MARLIPFKIRGVIWYQGESNSLEPWRVRQHARLFPLLVRDWREQWGSGDLPFLYCQLSGISTNQGYQADLWPEFRDQQRRFLAVVTNVGMAVTSDLGHPTDVHPRNKREVGLRLARWALAGAYGQAGPRSGPLPLDVRPQGRRLVVRFQHAEGGLRAAGSANLKGFEIAGATGDFQAAAARIQGGEVVLECPDIPGPVRVRYAWQPFPDANLVNGAGLPASTFSWPP